MASNENIGTQYSVSDGDVLLKKLLAQRIKEDMISPEMREQDDSDIIASAQKYVGKKRNVDFNMWHSVAAASPSLKLAKTGETVIRTHSQQNLDARIEMVHSALSVTMDKEELAKKFLDLSSSQENCAAVRQSGSIPVLVQLIHSSEESDAVRRSASQALHRIVRYHPDDKQGRREARVLKLTDELMEYYEEKSSSTLENHPGPKIAVLMKLSFDGEHRAAMSQLGALHVIAKLMQKDHEHHTGNISEECVAFRRYAMMALTNLTFGDGKSKASLCSMKPFLSALISQLNSPNEDLCQAAANVLRNLSWRADNNSKQALRELGAVTSLMNAALKVHGESTIRSVLSALWNLSAHCNSNKEDICNVNGAIIYLVRMLSYQAPSKTLAVVENAGGILRNISSVIALREDYRNVLRSHNCLQVLVSQLKSPSLTIVSNACGTLWNLSARNVTDQRALWHYGAVPMLRSLKHSKHRMISMGASAALKNLLSSRPDSELFDKSNKMPALLARKRRALEQELDPSLSETCDNLEQIESWDSFIVSTNSDTKNDLSSSELRNVSNGNDMEHQKCAKSDFNDVSCRKELKNLSNAYMIETDRLCKKSSSERNGFENEERGYRRMEESYDEDGYSNPETDIDQTTNYSLQYTEQDTVKTYHTEGTPHNFSSSNSVSDLHQLSAESPKCDDAKVSKTKMEEKSVTETPMMFSRTSSLGSLISCDNIHDDRSSVVSELSRVASGIVSPSELPDSPAHTTPSSPRSTKKLAETSESYAETTTKEDSNVFEDTVKIFKDETTPVQFSTATSLSSLTFDDEVTVQKPKHLPTVEEPQAQSCQEDPRESKCCESPPKTEQKAEVKKEVDTMLEECIENGKPELSGKKPKPQARVIPVRINPSGIALQYSKDVKTKPKQYSPSVDEDCIVNFCTEDTPASISHAASHSDLSLLCPSEDSFLQDSILPLSSCHDSFLQDNILPLSSCHEDELSVEEQKKLLNDCIVAGLKALNLSPEAKIPTSDELPLEEQKVLLKSCILAGINSVTSSKCPETSTNTAEVSEDEQKQLLKQCIAMGIRSIRDGSCDLENIDPPSFLAEANLENSLMNVDSIVSEVAPVDSPNLSIIDDVTLIDDTQPSIANAEIFSDTNETLKEKHTPKQKRREVKDRYSTYTIEETLVTKSGNMPVPHEKVSKILEKPRKSFMIKERRSSNKDRFKTRTLNDKDFNEIAEVRKFNRSLSEQTETKLQQPTPKSPITETSPEEEKPPKPQIVKPVKLFQKPKSSGIPVVNKPATSSAPARSKIPTKLPAPLHRQNTFTKDDQSPGAQSPGKCIPGLVSPKTEDTSKGVRFRHPGGLSNRGDTVRKRWSASDNSINRVNTFKTSSNGHLNLTGLPTPKTAPTPSSFSQKKEVASKISGLWKKSAKQTKSAK